MHRSIPGGTPEAPPSPGHGPCRSKGYGPAGVAVLVGVGASVGVGVWVGVGESVGMGELVGRRTTGTCVAGESGKAEQLPEFGSRIS